MLAHGHLAAAVCNFLCSAAKAEKLQSARAVSFAHRGQASPFDFGSFPVFSYDVTGKRMSITIQLDLPESVVTAAKARGLLDSRNLTRLVEREVELDQPRQDFRAMVEQMRAYPDEPMTMDEIQTVVNEVRARRRARR